MYHHNYRSVSTFQFKKKNCDGNKEKLVFISGFFWLKDVLQPIYVLFGISPRHGPCIIFGNNKKNLGMVLKGKYFLVQLVY